MSAYASRVHRGRRREGGGERSAVPNFTLPPPSFTSTPQGFRTAGPASPPDGSQWLREKIESWFGSVNQFSSKVVHGTRFLVVECLLYPCSVFSRQCQVFPYNPAGPALSAPFSSIVVMHSIAHTQGLHAWYRGWYSHLALLVVPPFTDAVLEKVQPPPKVGQWKLRPFLGHWILKGMVYATIMPLLSYNFVEMIQNTAQKVYVGGVMEVLRDRPVFLTDGSNRLPLLHLLLPTVLHGLAWEATSRLVYRLFHHHLPRGSDGDPLAVASRALWVDFLSSVLASVVLFPLETVVVRLYCQGLPLLVDDVQTGVDVVFISTYYRGLLDCVTGVWESEGVWGFYKGFSALLLRCCLQGLLLLLLWRAVHAVRARLNR